MKKILLLSVALIFTFITTALAQTERPVNPGVDPNEAKISKSSEADVGAPGVCRECMARMKHTRLKDDTTFRSGGGTPGTEATEGTQKGTK